MHYPTYRIIHTMGFVTPVVEHWLEREIVQWVHHEELIRQPIAPLANALTTELHLAPGRGRSSANGLVGTGFEYQYQHQT